VKTFLLAINRTNEQWLGTGITDYLNRVGRYIPFREIIIRDIKKSRDMSPMMVKEKEGAIILGNIGDGDMLVLLDENGVQLTSREFAGFMQKQMLGSTRNLFFVIGGAFGFSDAVISRADMKIALSRMTFSHQMARLIFAEQLYRALTILNNEPYHHD